MVGTRHCDAKFVEQSLRSILIAEDVGHGRTLWYSGKDLQRALVSDAHFICGCIHLRYTIAFQYPYVLAFEPTFVEIRNVETGAMSQVIQGNNLRCLYTDAPTSLPLAHLRHSQSSFSSFSGGGGGSGFTQGNVPLAPPLNAYNGRSSLPGAYGQSPVPMYPGQVPQPSYGRAAGREDIILVSDDRVLTLRMTALLGQ